MPFTRLKQRYAAFSERALAQLSEVERRDVRAFDDWLSRRHGWRVLVWILGGTTLAAYIASLLPWNMSFLEAGVLFNVVVLAMVWVGLTVWFGYRKIQGKVLRIMLYALAGGLGGTIAGVAIINFANGHPPFEWMFDETKVRHVMIAIVVFGFVNFTLVGLIANLRNREYAALTRHLEGEARQNALSRQLAESRLKLLHLQIEPHFLFNTLGSAQQLAEHGAPQAARLIADLIRFLRAATPTLRREWATLHEESTMIEAYLAIMRTRIGPRLRYRVDVPAALSGTSVPPGMLITLVENAIKHGIEPSAGGGEIVVEAALDAAMPERLTLVVRDTGAGLGSDTPGQGIGLANIRERLQLLYEGRAELELHENDPRGFVARLSLPIERGPVAPIAFADAATESR